MSECYNCAECKVSLYGEKYILKEENMYCIMCYEALFSTTCEVCQLLISCTSKVNHGDRNFSELLPLTLLRCKIWKNKVSFLQTELNHWACWIAVWCFCLALLSMVMKLITYSLGFLGCSLNQVSVALQDLSYKDRHWHSECFLCLKCSRSLVDRPFATKDDMLMCVECYSNEYSAKCHACMKTIMPGRAVNKRRRSPLNFFRGNLESVASGTSKF